jgi:hypothetical protein
MIEVVQLPLSDILKSCGRIEKLRIGSDSVVVTADAEIPDSSEASEHALEPFATLGPNHSPKHLALAMFGFDDFRAYTLLSRYLMTMGDKISILELESQHCDRQFVQNLAFLSRFTLLLQNLREIRFGLHLFDWIGTFFLLYYY